MSSVDELRLRETRREWKCSHPLRDDFGSIAVIAPVLLQSPESRKLFSCRCDCFSASPSLAHTSTRLGESIRERVVVVVACRDPPHGFVRSCAGTCALQTIVTVELQLGVRAAGSAS
jgi:hypothetical protein